MNEIEAIFTSLGFTVNAGALILTGACMNLLGASLKKANRYPNELIPLGLGCVASVMYSLLAGFHGVNLGVGFATGILAVGGYEMVINILRLKGTPPPSASQGEAEKKDQP